MTSAGALERWRACGGDGGPAGPRHVGRLTDLAVCMNQRVYDECQIVVILPAATRVWSIADLGEQGSVPRDEAEKRLRREEAYRDIAERISRLIAEFSPAPDAAVTGGR